MTENLINAGLHITETPIHSGQILGEVVGLIGRASEEPLWDSQDPREVLRRALIEGSLGRAIQLLVQSYLIGRREEVGLPEGWVDVGNHVNLDFGSLELYNSSSAPYDRRHSYRGPRGPSAWLRNYQGIADLVTRL